MGHAIREVLQAAIIYASTGDKFQTTPLTRPVADILPKDMSIQDETAFQLFIENIEDGEATGEVGCWLIFFERKD
jgi:hypothetical protein